jgi:hypothetical protein
MANTVIATIQSAAHTVSGGMLGPSGMAAGRGKIGRVHIVLAGNAGPRMKRA